MPGNVVSNLEQKQVAAHYTCFILQIHLFTLSQRITTEMSFMGEYYLKKVTNNIACL